MSTSVWAQLMSGIIISIFLLIIILSTHPSHNDVIGVTAS